MDMKEIREAYGEALRAYNELFSLQSRRIDREDLLPEGFSSDREEPIGTFRKKATEITPKLKEAADKSGNAVTWYRGDPLDGLDQSLQNRVLKALKFGI
jgi:hypothetical protein